MQTNILWKGQEYYSLENCLVNITDAGSHIDSTIIGKYDGKIYWAEYQIKTNQNWEIVFFEMRNRHSNQKNQLRLESDGKGNWLTNGKQADQFKGCMDIDISLTPFTNTLPINRLKLLQDGERQIEVIYIDVLENQVKRVQQKYIRLSNTEYHYENIPNDFEAKITVDEWGLVVYYPSLFVRKAITETNYL